MNVIGGTPAANDRLELERRRLQARIPGYWRSKGRHLLVGSSELSSVMANHVLAKQRIMKLRFPMVGIIGNSMAAKSQELLRTEKVLGSMDEFNTKGWNSVLLAKSKMGSTKDVIFDFVALRGHNMPPDQFTFAIALSASTKMGYLGFGIMVHCDALKNGVVYGSFCVSSLIDMYAKCRCVDDARKVFDEVISPDTVAWTTIISGYVRAGMPESALSMFDNMQNQGIVPDKVAFVTAIAACVNSGRIQDARNLFAQMPCPNDIAWTAIISGHAQNGHEGEALKLFKGMQGCGVFPTRSTLGSVLSATANLAAFDEGCQVHSLAVKFGLDSDVFVGSSLVSMYSKCFAINDAREVFCEMDERNLVTWNAIIGGYVQNGQPEVCIQLFLKMKEQGFQSDEFTYVSLFNACASLENLNLGRQLHSLIIKYSFDKSLFIGNAIIDMYAKSRELNDATQQFNLVSVRDRVTWNAIIVGQVHNEHSEEAMVMLSQMIFNGFAPDKVSFSTVLSACADLQAFHEGKQVHCLSIKSGLETNLYVGSSIVNFYSKLGDMKAASRAFKQMPERSVISWNALIEGHVLNNNPEEALSVFQKMISGGEELSECTFTSILSACMDLHCSNIGTQLHCRALKSNILLMDVFVGVSLVSMYLRYGSHESVNRLLVDFPHNNNVVFWTALISGQNPSDAEKYAFMLFSGMRSHNVQPDQASFVSILRVCADLATLDEGKEIHCLIIRTGYYSDECTTGSLVDMYSKCGDVSSSHQVFNEMEDKTDIISWNSMLVGFAWNGYAKEALLLFSQMKLSHIQPDAITFLGALTACSHAGLFSIGRSIFISMLSHYGINPRYDHYACMIDLLARGGYLSEAEEFIKNMPFEPDGVIWATLLSACRMHGNFKMAKLAAKKLIKLEPQKSSPYILLSNLCAASGNWDGFKMVRQTMDDRRVKKAPGCSWIMVGRKTSTFAAGDDSHCDAVEIYAFLEHLSALIKEDGIVTDHDIVLHVDG